MVSTQVNTSQRSYLSTIKFFTVSPFIFGWDAILFFYNFIAPKKAPGKVTIYGSKRPEYIAPGEGDSRSPCPALNALANHGIFPHNGRGISFLEFNKHVAETYNLAPTMSWFLPNYVAQMLSREYSTGTFDLEDLALHNGIEHDASLTREDAHFEPDQGHPSSRLINELLASGTGPGGNLTNADLAKFSSKRRVESRSTNKEFSLAFIHRMFGSGNAATMLTHFNGDIGGLKPFLLEERLPEGWEPAVNDAVGLTLAAFNNATLAVEMCVDEGKVKKE